MKLTQAVLFIATYGICSAAFGLPRDYYAQCTVGPYIGAQLGYGSADYGSKIKDAYNQYTTHSNDEDDLAGRAYLGYQFTPVFGAEVGYSIFSDNVYTGHAASPSTTFSKSRLETDAADLMATVGTPLFYPGLGLKIKGGVAYIMSHYRHSGNGVDTAAPSSSHNDRFAPTAGASLVFNLPDNVAFDLSYQRIFAPAHVDSPETDLVTLGLSYRFA